MAKSLNAARKAAKLERLDTLGADKFDFETSLSVVENVVGDFITRVKINLEQEDMIVSGKISDIQVEPNGDEIHVTCNKWLLFQDKGVNGSVRKLYNTPYSFKDKKPPIQPFIDWVEKRGITGEGAAYAIRESVFQNGIPPTNVVSDEIDELEEDLINALGNTVISVIMNTL